MSLLFPSMTVYIDPSRCPLKVYSDPVRSPGDVRVRTGDTLYKARCHGSVRFLAGLGRPGMCGCERVTRFTGHDAMGSQGFWPASVARVCAGANG